MLARLTPRSLAVALGAAASLLICSSCDGGGGSSVATPDAAPAQRVVLGTGEAEFEPISGEPRLNLVAGVQGGFHVWASFLGYGFPGPTVDMVLTTSLEGQPDSRLVMRAQLTPIEADDADGEPVHMFSGFPAQIKNARCAQDQRVTIELALSDAENADATDTRSCIAELAPMYRSENCE